MGGPRPADHGPEQYEDTAQDGSGDKTNHAGTDGCAEHVGGVVGPQRPTEEQTAGEEYEYSYFHDAEALVSSASDCAL